MRTLVIILALGTTGFGDEIVLKDGTVVVWEALQDDGASYVVTSPGGGTRRIPKEDVIQFRKVEFKTPLTGAIFTPDKKKGVAVDLLPKVDPAMAISGEWRISKKSGALFSPKTPHGRIVLPMEALGECDIVIQVRKVAGDGAIYFGIPIQSHMLHVDFDGVDNVERGIGGIPSTRSKKKTFKDFDRPYTIRFIARSRRFMALIDGKIAIDWRSPDYSVDTVPEKIKVSRRGLMIGVYDTAYSIERLAIITR